MTARQLLMMTRIIEDLSYGFPSMSLMPPNPFLGQALMFGDVVDVYQRGTIIQDEMGGTKEGEEVLARAGMACYIEDIVGMELAQLAAAGMDVQTAVIFPIDPGDLLRGAIIKVRKRAGREYAVGAGPNLRVRWVSTSNVGMAVLYRANCEGRS